MHVQPALNVPQHRTCTFSGPPEMAEKTKSSTQPYATQGFCCRQHHSSRPHTAFPSPPSLRHTAQLPPSGYFCPQIRKASWMVKPYGLSFSTSGEFPFFHAKCLAPQCFHFAQCWKTQTALSRSIPLKKIFQACLVSSSYIVVSICKAQSFTELHTMWPYFPYCLLTWHSAVQLRHKHSNLKAFRKG